MIAEQSELVPCCSPNPYDEGTESSPLTPPDHPYFSCSPNPYDEGTESFRGVKEARFAMRCSPNPYDEGTERFSSKTYAPTFSFAAAQIPMMRELKAFRFL